MISRTTLTLASVLALAHLGCGDDSSTNPAVDALPGAGTDGGAPTDGGTGTTSLTDGAAPDGAMASGLKVSDSAIAGVLTEANSAAVAAGNLAGMRSMNPMVKAFAQQMVTDHSAAAQRLMMVLQKAGLTAGDSNTRKNIATTAQLTLDQLMMRGGMAFDGIYVPSQADAHRELLRLIDSVLIPSAQNADLKGELSTARAAEAMHLSAAQTLMGGGGGAAPDAGGGQ